MTRIAVLTTAISSVLIALTLLASSDSVLASERCMDGADLRQVQLELTDVRRVQMGEYTLGEAEFEIRNLSEKEIRVAVSGNDSVLRIYTGSFGYQVEQEPGRWENYAINLDDAMAPDTMIELRKGAVARFVQDTSDVSGAELRGKAKRAWVKDEVGGCKFYSPPFSVPVWGRAETPTSLP